MEGKVICIWFSGKSHLRKLNHLIDFLSFFFVIRKPNRDFVIKMKVEEEMGES